MVRDFRVDKVLAVICAMDDSIVDSMVGSTGGEQSRFLLFPILVVDDRTVVVGTVIYMGLISFPAKLEEDGEVMEHFPFRNIVVCLPKCNWLIRRREIRNVGVWKAST